MVELVRTVTPLKLLTVFSHWSREVLDLFAAYTCANVPERLGDDDECLILIDKIIDDIVIKMSLFFLFFFFARLQFDYRVDQQNGPPGSERKNFDSDSRLFISWPCTHYQQPPVPICELAALQCTTIW